MFKNGNKSTSEISVLVCYPIINKICQMIKFELQNLDLKIINLTGKNAVFVFKMFLFK